MKVELRGSRMERIGGSKVWSRTNATERMSSAELIKKIYHPV